MFHSKYAVRRLATLDRLLGWLDHAMCFVAIWYLGVIHVPSNTCCARLWMFESCSSLGLLQC